MKIIILLFASFFSFGLAVQETVRVDASEAIATADAPEQLSADEPTLEKPAFSVLLDTVEITTSAPAAVALN